MDDARDIWNAVKSTFGGNVESKKIKKSMLKQEFSEFRISEVEGLHKGYDRMQKILSQLNQLKAKADAEEINLRFLRALPSPWSQISKDTLPFLQANLQDQAILHLIGNVIEDVLQLFVVNTKPKQQLAYEDLKQIEKLDLE
nr:ribonuclease H-like domain-containing protein [Tanacetum cinerariifolium]